MMDPVAISVTPPLGHAKGPSLSSDASLAGSYVALDKRGKIRAWIEDIDAIDNFTSRSSVAGTVISSEDSFPGRNVDRDSATVVGSDIDVPSKEIPGLDALLDEDFDMEDDFFVEAAQQALEKGRISFEGGDFTAADAYLQEALVMIKELAKKQQSVCDTWELRRMLGICAFHVHSAAEAEHALLSVLENAPKNAILNETQRLNVSETAHLLSQVYVKLGKLDTAHRYCEYALRGRRKVLGKNSEQSYDSLALMARILQLQENSLRAEFFFGMIPEAEREAYLAKFRDLSLPDGGAPPTEASSSPKAIPIAAPKPIRSMSDVYGQSAPKIPERSPSRGSISTPQPAGLSLRQEDIVRPVSALSNRMSTMSSEPGDAATVSSISLSGSPPQQSRFSPMTPPQNGTHTGQQQHLQSHLKFDRPEHSRTRSHSGSVGGSLPVIEEPDSPIVGIQDTLKLFPQPLRAQQQRPVFISELPGDSHYGQTSHLKTLSHGPLKQGKSYASKLPDPPRSVPVEWERNMMPQPPADVQPAMNDREKLPSQAAAAPDVLSQPENPRTDPLSMFIDIGRSTSQSAHEASSKSVPPQEAMQISTTESPDRPEPVAATQIHQPQLNPAISNQGNTAIHPADNGVVAESSTVSTMVAPDARRSDFQHSTWTPPIAHHPAQAQHEQSVADFGTAGPYFPPHSEAGAGQQQAYIPPRDSHSADRQSITSSNYSESTSTARSPQPYQTLPSVGTNLSQESGKSRRKASLLKVFRSHSSPSATVDRTPSINYNGVRLTRADTDSIKHEALTDPAIDFWQEHLEHDLLQRSARFVLMRPIRTALLQESITNNDPASLKAALPDLSPSKETVHIFIPLKNPKTSHRSLLLISPQDGLACHYDPLQPRNRKIAEILSKKINTHLTQLSVEPLEALTFYDVADTPTQQHDKDSGVYVCMYMQHLILKLQNTHVSQKVDASLKFMVDPKAARKTMNKVVEGRRKSAGGAFTER